MLNVEFVIAIQGNNIEPSNHTTPLPTGEGLGVVLCVLELSNHTTPLPTGEGSGVGLCVAFRSFVFSYFH